MIRKTLNEFSANATGTILAVFAIFCVFVAASAAQEVKLTLQDAPLTVLKDSSTTKNINGIPADTPGRIELEIKWHAKSIVPNTFNMLKIELLHGSNVISTKVCYSVHSDKNPKCYVNKNISESEANASGAWKLRVSNHSDHEVDGFNIVKEGTDLNPFVGNIKSTFLPDCAARYVTFPASAAINIPWATVEKEISGVLSRAGEIHIRAKWHNPVTSVVVFEKLRVELLHNGNVVATDEGYSIHSDEKGKTKKINIKYKKPATAQIGSWKLRIINDGLDKNDFNIEKGDDLNPFVPSFRSTFTPCK